MDPKEWLGWDEYIRLAKKPEWLKLPMSAEQGFFDMETRHCIREQFMGEARFER